MADIAELKARAKAHRAKSMANFEGEVTQEDYDRHGEGIKLDAFEAEHGEISIFMTGKEGEEFWTWDTPQVASQKTRLSKAVHDCIEDGEDLTWDSLVVQPMTLKESGKPGFKLSFAGKRELEFKLRDRCK